MKQQIDYIISQLRGYYPDEELRELAYWVVEEITGLTRAEILIADKGTTKNAHLQEKLLNVPIQSNLEVVLQQLRAHVPVQYIFGHTLWNGLDLQVTPATLIPRPETAELVDWVLSRCDKSKPLRVLDIGTGSGCIAIALKKAAPLWQVSGLDISQEALAVAGNNAQRNGVEVSWISADILSPLSNSQLPIVDMIISNPPYICDSERVDMDARVLDYEPHTALFVPDNDPLLFYRRIASLPFAASPCRHSSSLRESTERGCYLFFEINEAYGSEVCAMLSEMGYTNVELKHDMYGKPRMVFGEING
ncbi:MAG: peptide chain release factor N(5)-glutamine methyltransferase [Paludibacteraceae bacterium]|nr:peptide chain release factor N(5)-glutamine methyltransferase [Paludibacteraceae bacterium]